MEKVRRKTINNMNFENQLYLQERKALIDENSRQAYSYDKAILTLAGGSFGISLTVVNTINISQTKCLLGIAWIAFIVSILCTLISFLFSQKAYQEQMDILDNKEEKENKWNVYIWFINILSGCIFVLGAICLAIFVLLNL